MKLVTAGESIFHKFIILQAFPMVDREAGLSWLQYSAGGCVLAIHFMPYGCLRSA